MAKTRIIYRNRPQKKRGNGKRKITLPIAIVAGFASPVSRTIQHGMQYGITGEEGAVAELSRTMTGFNPFKTPMTWEAFRLNYGLVPVVAGIMIHKVAGYLGINRAIAQAGIPVLRI